MKAIILAAGIGSRLRPITDSKPKSLVNVNARPILYHALTALIHNGIKDVVICVGYTAAQVINYCESNFPEISFTFVENEAYEDTNNMYSLYLARDHLTEDIILMNADVVFDKEILTGMLKQKGTCIAVDKGRYNAESMKIIVTAKKVMGISKTIDEKNAYGCSIDIYKFTKKDVSILKEELIRIIEQENSKNQWTEVLLDKILKYETLRVRPFEINESKWYEIDNYEDLAEAEITFNTHVQKLREKKAFFIDLDGTLKLGKTVFPESKEFLNVLSKRKKDFFVLTNNSSRTPLQYTKEFKKIGLPVKENNILVSLLPALAYFKTKRMKRIYVLANDAVSSFIAQQGFIHDEETPEGVLITYDDQLTYQKLEQCTKIVRKGTPYYATHSDIVCPTEYGPIPDIGTFIKVIEMTTGIVPNQIFGKPNQNFLMPVLADMKIPASDAVIIGDRLYTDIKLAQNCGITSILVLSGETKREDYEKSQITADIVVRSTADLIGYL